MPLINIHMAQGRSQEEKAALLSAITDATVDAIGAPRETVRVWISEMPATDYMVGGELLSDKKARLAATGNGSDGSSADETAQMRQGSDGAS